MTGRFSLRISGGGVSPVALMLVTVAMWASAPLVVALLDVSGAPFLFAASMEAGALLAYLAFLLLFHRSLLGDPQVLRVLGRQLLLRDRRLAWLLLGVVSGLAYVFFIAGGMRLLFGGGGLEVLLGGSPAFLGSLLTVVTMASSVLWVRRVERRLSPELCSRLGHPGVVLCSVFLLMVLCSTPWALLSLSLGPPSWSVRQSCPTGSSSFWEACRPGWSTWWAGPWWPTRSSTWGRPWGCCGWR